jgi:hypothetical protein
MWLRSLALVSGVLLSASCGAAADRTAATPTAHLEASSSPTFEQQRRFVPRTYPEGDSVVMPVTFPDGTTAELVYPPKLDLSDLRVQPYSSGYGPGFARDFLVYDKPIGDVIGSYEDAELLAEYDDGHGGTVGFWRLPPDGLYLAFQFGSWTVLVYDYAEEGAQMSDEDRALWATNFHGRDAEDGFLILDAELPLTLARTGEHSGPELELWSRSGDFSAVLLFPGECTPYGDEMVNGLTVDRDDEFAAWCIPHAPMTVHVYQEPRDTFIDDVLSGLEVRNVNPPAAPLPSPEATTSGVCDFPSVRPGYLPWLGPGESVPSPTQERFEGYAHLYWSPTDRLEWEGSYVAMWRVDGDGAGPGLAAPPLPNGATGYLYESGSGDDVADWAIVWSDPLEDGCTETALALFVPSLSRTEGQREILRMAESLASPP